MLTFIIGFIACLIFPAIMIPAIIGFWLAGPLAGIVCGILGAFFIGVLTNA